jgi:hypothetical protein
MQDEFRTYRYLVVISRAAVLDTSLDQTVLADCVEPITPLDAGLLEEDGAKPFVFSLENTCSCIDTPRDALSFALLEVLACTVIERRLLLRFP